MLTTHTIGTKGKYLCAVVMAISWQAGCSVGEFCSPIPLVISSARSTVETRILWKAANLWNSAAGEEIVIVEPGGTVEVSAVTGMMDCGGTLSQGCATIPWFPGDTSRECYVELRNRGISEDLKVAVLAHELGHCAGLNHNGVPNTLMDRITFSTDEVSQESVDHFLGCR